jgi:hypothetical protein
MTQWVELNFSGITPEGALSMKGILLRNTQPEDVGFFQRRCDYQLRTDGGEILDVYNNDNDKVFLSLIGKRVEMIGKIQEFELEGRHVKEFWLKV